MVPPIWLNGGLLIGIPISDQLIENADTHSVATMAKESVGKAAYDAVYKRKRELEDE